MLYTDGSLLEDNKQPSPCVRITCSLFPLQSPLALLLTCNNPKASTCAPCCLCPILLMRLQWALQLLYSCNADFRAWCCTLYTPRWSLLIHDTCPAVLPGRSGLGCVCRQAQLRCEAASLSKPPQVGPATRFDPASSWNAAGLLRPCCIERNHLLAFPRQLQNLNVE